MTTVYVPENGAAFRAAFFPDGVERQFEGGVCVDQTPLGRGATPAEMAMVLVQLATDVGVGIISAALYDALRGQATWVRIGGKKVTVAQSDIHKALEETRTKPHDSTDKAAKPEDTSTNATSATNANK